MAKTRDYLDYLDEKVEIAPANSQEEYQAAQTIAELMTDHGLDPSIEEFEAHPLGGLMGHVLSIVLLVCLVVCGITHGAVHWVFLLLAVCAAGAYLYVHNVNNVFEQFGPVAKSQNVVAVHRADGDKVVKGARPIVIVAHYDTPREGLLWKAPFSRYQATLKRISVLCVLVVAVTLIVQALAFLPEALRVMIWILGILACLPPVVLAVLTMLEQRGACSIGSNNNKSSLAAMLAILDQVLPGEDRATAGDRPRKAQKRVGDEPQSAPVSPQVREVVEEVHGVRHGRDILMQLGILPPSCEVVYEEPKVRIVEEMPQPEPLSADEDSAIEDEQPANEPVEQDEWEEDYDADEWNDQEETSSEVLDDDAANGDDEDSQESTQAASHDASEEPPAEDVAEGEQADESDSAEESNEYDSEYDDDYDDDYDEVGEEELDEESYDDYEDDESYDEEDYDEEDYDEQYADSGDEEAPTSSVGSWFSNRVASIKSLFSSRKKDEEDIRIQRGENLLEDEGYLEDFDDEGWTDDDQGPQEDADEQTQRTWKDGIPNIASDQDDDSYNAEYDASHDQTSADVQPETSKTKKSAAGHQRRAQEQPTPQQMAEEYLDLSSIEGEVISYEEYEEIVYVDEEEEIYEDEVEIVYENEDEDTYEEDDQAELGDLEYEEYDDDSASSDEEYVTEVDEYANETEEYVDEYVDEYDQGYATTDEYTQGYVEEYDTELDDEYDLQEETEYVGIAYQEGVEETAEEWEDAGEEVYEEEVLEEDESYLSDPYQAAESAVSPSLGQRIKGVFRRSRTTHPEQTFVQDEQAWDEGVLDEDGYGPAQEYEQDEAWDNGEYLEDGQYVEEEVYEEDVEYVEDEYADDAYDEEDSLDVADERGETSWYEPPADPNILHFDYEQDLDVIPKDTTGLDTITDGYDVLEYRDAEQVREAPEPVNDPTWGTTSYQPARPVMNIARRAALFDLPDPSASGIDSFDSMDDDYDYDDETEEEQATQEVSRATREDSGEQGSFWGDSDSSRSTWKGGAAVRSDLRDKDEPLVIDEEDLQDAILEFGDEFLRGHDIWFVATGASSLNHAGIKDFVERHKRDVRGSFLVNLESVGAGELAVFNKEGLYSPRNADRRLVRMLTDIARDLHVNLDSLPFDWDETDSATTMRARLRSVTIAGVDDNNLLAYAHTREDTPENVNPSQVSSVVRIVTELIRRS
ncbi:MAG: hypothetical protein Q4A01_02705 [Coriobacteriales bacterium]|nr:hypothetical protein [Coriobacteriales bacterium]